MGKNLQQMLRCCQSFFSGMDSGQHRSLHRAFRSFLAESRNV